MMDIADLSSKIDKQHGETQESIGKLFDKVTEVSESVVGIKSTMVKKDNCEIHRGTSSQGELDLFVAILRGSKL